MSTTRLAVGPASNISVTHREWMVVLAVLAASLVVLGIVFAEEGIAAVQTWKGSTAYNHCWLVLPIAAWLAWTRRDRLVGLRPAPTLLPAIPAVGAALTWLAAERLGVMEGRQLAAIALVVLTVVAIVGLRVGQAMAAPLAYLVFLVPFGAFAVPLLQRVTAWFIVLGLQLLAIPHYVDDLVIEIPAGTFFVAEACAGLRFIVASLAFGALYAVTMFRSPGRRVIVLALALIVPLIANGLRAFGIVLLGHHLGSAQAAAADHVVYGWSFFSVVILLLVVAGLPFRQDATERDVRSGIAATSGRMSLPRMIRCTAMLLAFSVAGPATAAWLVAGSQAGIPVTIAPTAPEGCTSTEVGLRCGGTEVTVRVLQFPSRLTWSAITMEGHRHAVSSDEAVTFSVISDVAIWRVRQSSEDGRTVAIATWLGGRAAGGGLRSRVEQAWSSLHGGGTPVLAVITVQGAIARGAGSQSRDRTLVRRILEVQDRDWARVVARLSDRSS